MRRWILIVLSLSACLAAGASPVFAAEFQVNTYTTSEQYRSSVAIDSTGNFVVVWQSYEQDGSGWGIFGQRFDAAGAPQGGEFQANTYTSGGQRSPSAAMDPSGRFVVVWQSTQDGQGSDVFAQRFDSDGSPLGPEFQVNSETTSSLRNPDVAVDDEGNFIVVWLHAAYIRARRFDASGAPVGSQFDVSTLDGYDSVFSPAVAMSGAGQFAVAWSFLGNTWLGSSYVSEVRLRAYNSSGSPLCEQRTVREGSAYLSAPDLDMAASGDFVIAWSELIAGSREIMARRYHNCTALDAAFLVNTSTTGAQNAPNVAVDSAGRFIVAWQSPQNGSSTEIVGQRFDGDGDADGLEFMVNTYTLGDQLNAVAAMNDSGASILAWDSPQDGSGLGVYASDSGPFPTLTPTPTPTPPTPSPTPTPLPAGPAPEFLTVDAHGTGTSSNLNGVLEAGEAVVVEPAWKNPHPGALSFTGTASDFTGPAGPVYALVDGTADYGTVPGGTTANCFEATSEHDCYQMTVTGIRPVSHWDGTFLESLSIPNQESWTLHVGESFEDVPSSHPFYAFIENLLHNGVSGGCGGGSYCPEAPVRRDQMAVFLLKARHGGSYVPPPCTGAFVDVPCPGPFANWIEQLLAEDITGGCGGANYCPSDPVTRAQMAVFLLMARHGTQYAPPACTGVFVDVPCPSIFGDWIEALFHESITAGCGGGNYCPNGSSTRGQMAVFLVKAFGLRLYGP